MKRAAIPIVPGLYEHPRPGNSDPLITDVEHVYRSTLYAYSDRPGHDTRNVRYGEVTVRIGNVHEAEMGAVPRAIAKLRKEGWRVVASSQDGLGKWLTLYVEQVY